MVGVVVGVLVGVVVEIVVYSGGSTGRSSGRSTGEFIGSTPIESVDLSLVFLKSWQSYAARRQLRTGRGKAAKVCSDFTLQLIHSYICCLLYLLTSLRSTRLDTRCPESSI